MTMTIGIVNSNHPLPMWSFSGIIKQIYTCNKIKMTPCKGIRIPKCRKCVLVESGIWENLLAQSGILCFGVPNSAQRNLNPTKD